MNPKKENILSVAIDLLSNIDNNQKFTLSNIASECGIGKSTLYEYFENKTQIVEEALVWMMETESEALLKPLDNTQSFKETLMAYLQRVLNFTKERHQIQTIVNHYEVVTLPQNIKLKIMAKMHEIFKLSEKRFDAVLTLGLNEGVIKDGIKEARKNAIKSMIFGGILAINQPFNEWDSSIMIEELYESIIVLHNT